MNKGKSIHLILGEPPSEIDETEIANNLKIMKLKGLNAVSIEMISKKTAKYESSKKDRGKEFFK